jgi:hypothetical protein
MAKSTKSTYKPAKKGNYKPVVRMAGGGNVSELNYSERREYIEENYAPFITDAQMIFSIWDSGIEYDYKADRKEVVSSIIDSYRELGDYTESTLPQETIYEIQDWDLVRREIDPETDEVIGETPLEELSADNTYNFSYNGLVDLNWRVYHDVDYDRFFYVIMPHLGGDIRGNYGDAIILEGNDKDELFYRFYEGFISGGASIYIKFKDGSEIGFDSEQDSDVFYFRVSESFEPTGMAQKYLNDFEQFESWQGDEFLEETIDIYLARKGVAPKMMAGGSLNDETPMAYIQILGYDEGQWFNLTDYSDGQDVIDGIFDFMNELNNQFGGNREEFEVTDYEGFGDDLYDRYMGANEFEEIIEAYEKYESSDFPADVISAYKNDSGSGSNSLSDVIDEMDNNYFGKYDNLTDFGYEMVQQGVYEPSDNDVYITDTDKRIIAGEESDSLVNDMSFEDLMNIAPDTQSEYDDEKSELEDKIVEIQEEIKDLTSLLNDAEDDDEYERISDEIESKEIDLEDAENSYVDIDSRFEDKAREEARDSIYDEIYDKLENDLSSWLEEYGYTSELQNLSFLSVDYENIGDYLSSDYLIVEYDGEMYFFNNYAKGGRITASKRKPKYAFYIVESSTKKLVSGYSTKAEATEQRKLLVQQYPSMRFEIYPLANLEAKTDLDVYAKKDYVELSTLDKIKKVSVDAYRYGQEKVGQAQMFLEKNDVKSKIKRGARKVADKTKQGVNWLRNKWLEADFGDGTGRAKFFADGGGVGIHFKNFTIDEFKSFVKSINPYGDIEVSVSVGNNVNTEGTYTKKIESKKIKDLSLSIGDGKEISVHTGSENIYADVLVYDNNYDKGYKEYTISLFSKDDREGLKSIVNSIIKKFAYGGVSYRSRDIDKIKVGDIVQYANSNTEYEAEVIDINYDSQYKALSSVTIKWLDNGKIEDAYLQDLMLSKGNKFADGGELYDMSLPMGFYVKINPHYTATIRNLKSFESYLERKDELWGKEFGEITNVDKSASKEWVSELNRLIEKKKSELENKGTGNYKVGDEITLWRNQADRDGYVIAVYNNEILVEYEMPNGTTALNIIDLTLPEYDKYNYTKNYTTISYEKARLSKKWGNKIDASRLINNPQGSAKRYNNGGMAGLGEVSGMLPNPLPMSTITPMANGGSVQSEIVYLDNRIYNLEELVERINEDEKPEMYATINKLKKEREHLIKRGNNPEEVKPKKSFFGLFAKGGEMKLPKDNSRVHFKDDQNKEYDGIFVAEGNGNPSMFLIGFGQGASDFRFAMEVVDWHYLDKKHNHDAHAKHEASETAEEEKAEHEYDVYDNKRMLENQANEIEHHSEELSEQVKNTKKVPAWVIAKMERATTDLSDITHYLDGENKMANGGNVGEVKYEVLPHINKFIVAKVTYKQHEDYTYPSKDFIYGFDGKFLEFNDMKSAQKFIDNIEPKYPYGIPKANVGMLLMASQLMQQKQQQQQQPQQPQVVYYVPQPQPQPQPQPIPQELQNTGIVQNIPEMASGGDVGYDDELINDFCMTNLIELANELQSVKYYVTHRFKETDFESKNYKGRLVIVFKESASVNVIESITKFVERAEDCHHLFEQSVNVSGSEPNSISINLLSDKFSDREFGKGGKVYDYAPKKINLAKTKKITTHIGDFNLGLITNDFVYFVNVEEGDDNGNTIMYNKNGELLSDNIHATNDLFETLENQSKFEFIHPDLEKYRQEILKGN